MDEMVDDYDDDDDDNMVEEIEDVKEKTNISSTNDDTTGDLC